MTGCVDGYPKMPRIRVAFAAERGGIASALNGAGALADGEYTDISRSGRHARAATALHFSSEACRNETFDILYSDEDWMNERGQRIRPNFKPDWSPELLAGCMYFGHLFVAKREAYPRRAGSAMASKARRIMIWRCDWRGVAHRSGMYRVCCITGACTKDRRRPKRRPNPTRIHPGNAALEEALRANGVTAPIEDGPVPHTYAVRMEAGRESCQRGDLFTQGGFAGAVPGITAPHQRRVSMLQSSLSRTRALKHGRWPNVRVRCGVLWPLVPISPT